MQKFIVQSAPKKTGIGIKDMMLPFNKAVIEIVQAKTTITLFELPLFHTQEPNKDPYEDIIYAVFVSPSVSKEGFILQMRESEHYDGYEPFFMDFSNVLSDEEMKKLGWVDFDVEKNEQYAMSVINFILYVSHVCHHTAIYRKIQKKYEKHELKEDITNPAPKRMYLSGSVSVEWINDESTSTIRKYVRHTEGWDVRGHYRHYKSGKTIFIKPHHKGKAGYAATKEFEIGKKEVKE